MNELENRVIKKATFDPAVKTYIFFVVLFYMIITVVGIVLIPFWVLGLGQWLSSKFYNTLSCELSEKHLKFGAGLLFQVEKTIPLENIQDLSFIGGPVLRAFGLTILKLETAGGGAHNQQNLMKIIGMDDAHEFKHLILEQREKLKHQFAGTTSNAVGSELTVLQDIKAELSAIKELLQQQKL
ncbi:MAG: PH domain-containing protein [Sediminibacterium sp.]|nr:PH domain-containing protein [Sediminibacterium sp.]